MIIIHCIFYSLFFKFFIEKVSCPLWIFHFCLVRKSNFSTEIRKANFFFQFQNYKMHKVTLNNLSSLRCTMKDDNILSIIFFLFFILFLVRLLWNSGLIWSIYQYFFRDRITFAEYGNFGPGSNMTNRVKWISKLDSNTINSMASTTFIDNEGWLKNEQF